jgi:uncharacterized membrane protein YcaP (DUF421 family)
MAHWLLPDWLQMFAPDTPLLEIFLRGSLMYLALFAMIRFVLKRQAGDVSLTDVLLIVLIADAAQNAMADDYTSIPDGILLVGTLVFWNFALDWLAFRFPRVRKLVHPDPLPLVRDGHVLQDNLRKELITEDELMSQLRQQGVDDVGKVKEANMEGDGRVSVIEKEAGTPAGGGSACPAPEQTDDGGGGSREVEEFLKAAARLQELGRWHEEQMAAIKGVLAAHGVRAGLATGGRRAGNGRAEMVEPLGERGA